MLRKTQDVKIKRLRESLDIRDKVILQLEAQLDKAATYIGSRDTARSVDKPSEIQGSTMFEISLKQLTYKIESLANFLHKQNSVNNITVNNLGNKDMTSCVLSSKFTQTHPPVEENVPGPSPMLATDAPRDKNRKNVEEIKCSNVVKSSPL